MIPTIRLATLSDLPTIRALWRAMMTELRPSYPIDLLGSIDVLTRELALALAAEPPTVTCFLAEHVGNTVGFLLYERQRRHFGEPHDYAFVHHVYIDPTLRHLGIGTLLCAIAAEHMVASNLAYCEMLVRPGDAQWDALGFTPFETRMTAPVATALGKLQERTVAQAARRGNGLDPDALPAPQPAADQESEQESE